MSTAEKAFTYKMIGPKIWYAFSPFPRQTAICMKINSSLIYKI